MKKFVCLALAVVSLFGMMSVSYADTALMSVMNAISDNKLYDLSVMDGVAPTDVVSIGYLSEYKACCVGVPCDRVWYTQTNAGLCFTYFLVTMIALAEAEDYGSTWEVWVDDDILTYKEALLLAAELASSV